MPNFIIKQFFGLNQTQINLIRSMAKNFTGRYIKVISRTIPKHPLKVDSNIKALRIHGDKDNIISKPDNVDIPIHDGGHLISITHAQLINKRINKWRSNNNKWQAK